MFKLLVKVQFKQSIQSSLFVNLREMYIICSPLPFVFHVVGRFIATTIYLPIRTPDVWVVK